jgi:hypothetical protein
MPVFREQGENPIPKTTNKSSKVIHNWLYCYKPLSRATGQRGRLRSGGHNFRTGIVSVCRKMFHERLG